MSENRPLEGGCLCGKIRYEVTGPFLRAGHCHCSRCRKHSGAAVGTQGRVRREDFRLVFGEESLRVYDPGEGAAVKAFCGACGSSLFGGTWPEGPEVSIRLGSVDGDPGIRPQYHTFVGSRAVWDEITDDLPQYEGPLPRDAE
ncbi:MAG TPA: GFA family protein [Thermoanaerobaculia bacterium]|nr:GFA family protein [Thermoanaerobaculia bacterium]